MEYEHKSGAEKEKKKKLIHFEKAKIGSRTLFQFVSLKNSS